MGQGAQTKLEGGEVMGVVGGEGSRGKDGWGSMLFLVSPLLVFLYCFLRKTLKNVIHWILTKNSRRDGWE